VEDYPGRPVTELPDYDFSDSLYVDDRFEMYVLYFSGSDPTHPGIQRPLGKLTWNWGGLVNFDWKSNLNDASTPSVYQCSTYVALRTDFYAFAAKHELRCNDAWECPA
jgi:hypothetical protein